MCTVHDGDSADNQRPPFLQNISTPIKNFEDIQENQYGQKVFNNGQIICENGKYYYVLTNFSYKSDSMDAVNKDMGVYYVSVMNNTATPFKDSMFSKDTNIIIKRGDIYVDGNGKIYVCTYPSEKGAPPGREQEFGSYIKWKEL